MNINNLQGLLNAMLGVREWALIQTEFEENDINQEDLADLSEEQLRELRELENTTPLLLEYVHELKEQCTLVINTNKGVCRRVQEIFFSRSRIFRFIIFSGLLVSSIQLHQQWTSLQEEELLQVKQIQDFIKKSLITGFFSGACWIFDSKDLLEYFSDNLTMRIERIQSRLRPFQMPAENLV